MSQHLHDLHLAAEPRPGPKGFFDHPFRVGLAVVAGVLLGTAVIAATDFEPNVLKPWTDGIDVYVLPGD